MEHLERDVLAPGELVALVDRIVSREVDPYTAANEILSRAISGQVNHEATKGTRSVLRDKELT
jgi:hypothetical protein